MCRPGSEDPHRCEPKLCVVTSCYQQGQFCSPTDSQLKSEAKELPQDETNIIFHLLILDESTYKFAGP